MSRLAAAALLVAVGLGVGLWLGFDPQAHAAVQENWARTTQSVAEIQEDLAVKIDTAPSESGTPAPSQEPLSSTEVSRVLDDFWKATKQLWFNLLARLDVSR